MTIPVSAGEMAERQPKFCGECGKSLRALNVPYISFACKECGKTVFTQPPAAPGGQDINIPDGTRFTIPAGWLQISLRPDARGHLYRGGVEMMARWLFAAGQPKRAEDLESLFEHYRESSDKILHNSPLLAGLDLDSEEGGAEAWKRINEKEYSLEYFAGLRGGAASGCKEALKAGDARTAAFMMYHSVIAHVLGVFKSEMEESLWRGHLASRIVHESAAAAAKTVAEAEAIKKLEPLFSRLDEAVLHAWVNSGSPIGPRIGVQGLGEEILKPLAEWHLSQFKQKREDERRKQEFEMQQKIRTGTINISNSVLGTLNTGNIAKLNLSMDAIRVSVSNELAEGLKQFAEAVGNSDIESVVKDEVLENLSFVAEQVTTSADQQKRGVVKAAIEKVRATVSDMAALWGIWQKLEPLLKGVFGQP